MVAGAVAVGWSGGCPDRHPGSVGRGDHVRRAPTIELDDRRRRRRGAAAASAMSGASSAAVGDDGVLDAAAKALNLSTEDLLEKLRDGKTTIADVAEQQNVDVQTVIDAMEAVAKQEHRGHGQQPAARTARLQGRSGTRSRLRLRVRVRFPRPARVVRRGREGARASRPTSCATTLRDGQSIADIAKAKNVDLDTVIDALVKRRDGEDRRGGEGREAHAGTRPTRSRPDLKEHDHRSR